MSRPTCTPPFEAATRPKPPELPPLPDGASELADALPGSMDCIAARLAAVGIEPMVGIDEWAAALACSRRAVERMRAAGKMPRPDLAIGRSPRWKAATLRAWIDDQARASGRGPRR